MTHTRTPKRPLLKSDGGVFLPTSVVVTLLLAAAGVASAVVFTTKTELLSHAKADSERTVVLEQVVKKHDEGLAEVRAAIKTIDVNLRVLMIEQGVAQRLIKPPPEPVKEK